MNMAVDEYYKDDAPTFTYNGLRVPIEILFDQIIGFILYSREGFNLLPVTSMDDMSPEIRGLKTYFTLRNPRWIEQHDKGVRRKNRRN